MSEAFEIELPAVYLDAVLMDPTPVRPAVINRDPEPGEREVPLSSTVAFDLTDIGPDGVDLAATRAFVGGAIAFDGSSFTPGFDGPRSTITTVSPDTLRLVIHPTAPFSSLQVVAVRVLTATLGSAIALDAAWSFSCEDRRAPEILSAQARELRRIRVSFTEAVKQADPNEVDGALNPARYRLTALSLPAVPATIVAVEPVGEDTVDLLAGTDLTPDAAYTLEVEGVADVFGNVIAAGANTISFVAFSPPCPAARRFDLYSFLPLINRREDETGDLRRFLACLQEVARLLLADIDAFSDLFDPDVAPEWAIVLMLGELGDPFPFDLSLADKRRLLRILVAVYREKGTATGIRNAIRFFLGIEVEVAAYAGESLLLGESLLGEDWVLAPSTRYSIYSFEVVVPRALAAQERTRLRQIVDYMKPAHTHFLRLSEPLIPEVIAHIELGRSELGDTWMLH
jgi:phage tail-like protein